MDDTTDPDDGYTCPDVTREDMGMDPDEGPNDPLVCDGSEDCGCDAYRDEREHPYRETGAIRRLIHIRRRKAKRLSALRRQGRI